MSAVTDLDAFPSPHAFSSFFPAICYHSFLGCCWGGLTPAFLSINAFLFSFFLSRKNAHLSCRGLDGFVLRFERGRKVDHLVRLL